MSLSDSFAPAFASRSPLRQAIIHAMRQPEEACVAALTPDATLSTAEGQRVTDLAAGLATALRAERKPGIVESLVQEFALSSAEGVALMCLAEALLRIPDTATRDALIRDKIGEGDWLSHVSRSTPILPMLPHGGLLSQASSSPRRMIRA